MDTEIWEALRYADFYERGMPPVAGGLLDQAHWFVEACQFIWKEEARVMARNRGE